MAEYATTRGARVSFTWNGFALALVVAAAVIAVLGTVFWVGYQGSDDGSYIDAALAWYRHFPQVGHTHWDVRYPIIFALDAGFWIFGVRELAVGMAMLAYLFALVAVSIWMLQRWFGVSESLIFVVIFCAMPGVIVISTYANDDVTELFYVVTSFALYCAAYESSRPRLLLVCAGLAAGLAFMTRETTAGLILAYGLLFLLRPGLKRTDYFFMGFGFAILMLAEMAYYTIEIGNPLWRFTIDAHADTVNRAGAIQPGQVIDREGNLHVGGSIVSSLLVFLASQKYAAVFYGMLCLIPLLVRSGWNNMQRSFLVAAGALFIAWAGFIILNVSLLYLVPRYFLVTAWVAAILVAIGLVRLWRGRPRLAGALLAVLLVSDAACLYVEDTDPIQASRAAIAVALQSHEPVYTDPITRRRGRFLAQVAGVADDIIAAKPKPGSLYVLAPDNLARCYDPDCAAYLAQPISTRGMKKIEQITPPPRAIGALLDKLKLTQLIPKQIRRKLIQPNSGVTVYRVGSG
ncbi:MAG TPA: hypothetical protein VGM07_14155 [Stellaceae bacterium]